jgi:hypothetical protein
MSKLVISLATRGRPDRLLDTVKRSVANLVCDLTELMIQVDEDDHATVDAHHDILKAVGDDRVWVDIRSREDTIAEKWNRAAEVPADLYLVAADDDPYITPRYDEKLLEAAELFDDGIGMVYGHMANASFSGVVAPTRKLVEKMGGIFPTYFPYWFVDHWTDDIARIIGRISFADVRTDQSNPGKTQEMREPGWWGTFFDAGYMVRRNIARGIIECPDFHESCNTKTRLINQAPLIEFRSKWINQHLRDNDRAWRQWSGLTEQDPRYLRVKQRAISLLDEWLLILPPDEAQAYRNYLLPPTIIRGPKQAYT